MQKHNFNLFYKFPLLHLIARIPIKARHPLNCAKTQYLTRTNQNKAKLMRSATLIAAASQLIGLTQVNRR